MKIHGLLVVLFFLVGSVSHADYPSLTVNCLLTGKDLRLMVQREDFGVQTVYTAALINMKSLSAVVYYDDVSMTRVRHSYVITSSDSSRPWLSATIEIQGILGAPTKPGSIKATDGHSNTISGPLECDAGSNPVARLRYPRKGH